MSFENFFDRMGNIIRSYLDDSDVFKTKDSDTTKTGYDFYDQAYQEINDFLNNKKKNNYEESSSNQKEDYFSDKTNSSNKNNSSYSGSSYNSDKTSSYKRQRTAGNTTQRARPERPHLKPVPYELVPDFQKLGVPSGSPLEVCKAEYKKLLKMHHPDKNAGSPQALKEATRKTAEINDAYQRIEDWYAKQ